MKGRGEWTNPEGLFVADEFVSAVADAADNNRKVASVVINAFISFSLFHIIATFVSFYKKWDTHFRTPDCESWL